VVSTILDTLQNNPNEGLFSDLGRVKKICEDALQIYYFLLLWDFHELIQLSKTAMSEFTLEKSEHDQESEDMKLEDFFKGSQQELFNQKAEMLLAFRKAMTDTAVLCMRAFHKTEKAGEEEILESKRLFFQSVAIAGFQFVSSLRSMFPQKQNQLVGLDRLVFVPTQEVLSLMKFCFDAISEEISRYFDAQREDGNQIEEKDRESLQGLSTVLVKKLLIPLSGSFAFDIQNLNRRQAAAVLQFILHKDQQVQDTVKTIAKRLRDSSIVTFLEVQLVTMRTCYNEDILLSVQRRLAAEENDQDDVDFDFVENDQLIQAGYEKLASYSRKFSSLLGVGKLKDTQLEAVDAFLKLAMDFTLSDIHHVGFAEAASPFLRFLPVNHKHQFHSYLTGVIEANPVINEEIQRQFVAPNREFSKFFAFLSSLSGGKDGSKSGKRKLSSTIKDDDRDHEDIEEDIASFVVSPQKKTQVATPLSSKKETRSVGSSKKKAAPMETNPFLSDGKRKSTRNKGKRKITYHEDDDEEGKGSDEEGEEDALEEIEEADKIEEHEQPQSSNKRKANSMSQSSGFAMGLDIEDFSEEDVEEPKANKRRKGSQDSSRNTKSNKTTTMISTPAKGGFSQSFMLESTPVSSSALQDLAAVPSRRRLLG
jgi:hypothetical protein